MQSAHSSDTDDGHAMGPHPETPAVIRDEAAPTPMWVPLTGLALFVGVALIGLACRTACHGDKPEETGPSMQARDGASEGQDVHP